MHAALVLILLAATFFSTQSRAACLPADITSLTYSSTALAPYNPFSGFSPKSVTVSVSASKACSVEVAVLSPSVPAQMTGAGLLAYDLQGAAGASILYQGGNPAGTVHVDIPGSGTPGSATLLIALQAGQIVADGAYADTGLTLQAFDKNGAIYTPLKSAGMSVAGTVAKVCQFTLPQSPQLNFSSAIVNGLPNSNVSQTVTFTGVSCTAPTVVQLNGARLQSLDSPNATGGFDNFIDYIASAVFNSASAVLDTSAQTQSTSLGRSTAGGATVDGTLSVNVRLRAGRPLLAGRYQTTLTVTIDPSL